MKPAWAIAKLTVRDIVRSKTLIPVGVVALLVLASEASAMYFMRYAAEAEESGAAEAIAYKLPEIIFVTFGAAGWFMAFLFGVGLARHEIQDRTVLATLSRPIARSEYLMGRWLGLMLFLTGYCLVVDMATIGVAILAKVGPNQAYAIDFVLHWVSLIVLATIGMCANTVVRSTVAGAVTLLVCFLPGMLRAGIRSPSLLIRWPARLIDFMLPAWDSLSYGSEMFKKGSLTSNLAGPLWALVHGFTYTALLLILAAWLFRRVSVVTTES
jgi:ABC-type transport system involved in multi-copper enzyme maturation permease subunit